MATSTQQKIKHIVVLMLENRSFDHMLGGVKFAAKVEQPKGTETNPDANGTPVPISFKAPLGVDVGPDHGHLGVMEQLTGKKPASKPPFYPKPYVVTNKGFVANFEHTSSSHKPPFPGNGKTIMRCHPESNLPVLATLAKEFAVCDHWFCSVPGQTWPNRNYAHAGTSDGEVNIRKRVFDNDTIFERLDAAKKRWRVYHDGVPEVWAFPSLWKSAIFRGRFHSIDRLEEDVARDNLPEYTFIEPRHFGKKANSQHPDNPANANSFHAGEALIKRVYDALTSNPKIWNATLLVVTYDEHGGFYDHVAPPTDAVRPDKKGSDEGFLFDMLGVRVPAVLVSPWIPRGSVDSTRYDHSSIARSVRELFIPNAKKLSDREDVANTFLRNASLAKARTDIPKVALSAQATEKLDVVLPIATVAAMKSLPVPTELDPNEEAFAWLAFNVARTLQEEKVAGVASIGTKFFEETAGRLVTKAADAATFGLAAAASGPPPIVITNSDQLSAFGSQVAQMFRDSAVEEKPVKRPTQKKAVKVKAKKKPR